MKKSSYKYLLLLTLFVSMTWYACVRPDDSVTAKFPETPTNLTDFNTEFDDYNSTAPSFGETFPFCFSSNRNSNGNQFDIVYMLMSIEFDKDSKELSIYNNKNGNLDVVRYNAHLNSGMNKINTSTNEFGPYLIPKGLVIVEPKTDNRYYSYVLLYSSEENQNQNIKFTHNLQDKSFVNPMDLDFLNTEFDEAYPSFNSDFSELCFASNREGKYNIYTTDIDMSKDLIDVLTNTSSVPKKQSVLSSDFDDTCPFIQDSLLVFTSNREGGYGGYDLYYSTLESGQWSAPINFGPEINSSFDEFRPIVRKEWEFDNDIMIFSSNRPGGKGGFDLYYVGIDQLRK